MRCENNFCIYCDNNQCILENISLTANGTCSDCIHINIDDDILKSEKQKLLNKFGD